MASRADKLLEEFGALVDGFVFETDSDFIVTCTAGEYPHDWPEDVAFEGQTFKRLMTGVADGAARHAINTMATNRERIRRLRYAADPLADTAYEISVTPLYDGKTFTGVRGLMVQTRGRPQVDIARAVRGDVLSTISHELRTPLNAIIGFAEIIKAEMLGPMGNDSYRDYVEDIHRSGRNLLQMVDDILGIAELESGRLELREGPVDLGEALGFCLKMYGGRFAAKDIEVIPHIALPGATVWGDPMAVRQMILHLLSNAERFVEPGGAVEVSINRGGDGTLKVAVMDTGVGIDPEQLGYVLIPFIEDDPAVSRGHGGVGLGLPLTKALLDLHGGHIEIDSRKGEGTEVSLVFPAERVLDPAQRPALRVV